MKCHTIVKRFKHQNKVRQISHEKKRGCLKRTPSCFICSFLFACPKRTEQKQILVSAANLLLRARRSQTNQRKKTPEPSRRRARRSQMKTSAFFGEMPLASRAQKRLKFAPFPVCYRTFCPKILLTIDVVCLKEEAVSNYFMRRPSFKYCGKYYLPNLIEACAAASLAIGTLNGEQLTYVSPVLKQNSTEAGSPPCSPHIPTFS